ncbi:MAG: hypothetical protein H7Z21_04070 [Hymenobacter sp.]|nr:hypothetical protein [Hymenobacter sp.]
MKKTFSLGLLAASLMLSATSCSNPEYTKDEEMATKPLPPIPAAPDTTGGKSPTADSPNRELTAPNATEDIKKMQPVM